MIYLDCDGVLADMVPDVNSRWPHLDWGHPSKYDIFNADIEDIFRNAPRTIYFDYLYNLYKTRDDVKVLTALSDKWATPLHRQKAINNKHFWLKNNGFKKEDIIIVETSHDKAKLCQPGDILYDDKKQTIKEWVAAGGIAFQIQIEATNKI